MSTLNDFWWAREIQRVSTFDIAGACSKLTDQSLGSLHTALTNIREVVRAEWRSRHAGDVSVNTETGAS